MDKKITLVDYKDRRVDFTIKDFEKVFMIEIEVISGDEVAKIIYNDKRVVYFDSCENRIMSFNDGSYMLPLERLDEFNNCKCDSYDRSLKFGQNKGEVF